ncbi:HECT-domain (ubiquitin-transferase) domain-containing protein [Besnoitia besnoiti]|uniref:HECT-domain (Ubiquitin-transferase) domain-containing protein n=1 Tax=Besnoitia besnoiti TaxID=94643 RepID=A0A2A9MKC7_BESBE|nr:HECT-domain (ubiquitin-transferase) domain-containing protein [Besnoitia besnoiti]PFH36067.1 HECT-domain (ubiquitin-transferase) domain-containing protein [Besnoitia besnoiti]
MRKASAALGRRRLVAARSAWASFPTMERTLTGSVEASGCEGSVLYSRENAERNLRDTSICTPLLPHSPSSSPLCSSSLPSLLLPRVPRSSAASFQVRALSRCTGAVRARGGAFHDSFSSAAAPRAAPCPNLTPPTASASCSPVLPSGSPCASHSLCASSFGALSAASPSPACRLSLSPACLLSARRFFGVGGSYGYDAFFRGAAEVLNGSNINLPHLPKQEEEPEFSRLHAVRLPHQVKRLGANYFFRRRRAAPLTYYHHMVEPSGGAKVPAAAEGDACIQSGVGQSLCFVASAKRSYLQSKELENAIFESTRGFACQLILEGRGVKAYFEPDYPNLMVRLGVGVKPLALRRLAEQYATRAKIFVDKRGLLLTVHGYDKCAVGTLTMALFNHLQANPYTMKGAHVAMHPIKKKVTRKK